MGERKHITLRIDAEKWQRAKIKMLERGKGETFQDICEQAIDKYIEENDEVNKKK
jgi:hypothetical protein